MKNKMYVLAVSVAAASVLAISGCGTTTTTSGSQQPVNAGARPPGQPGGGFGGGRFGGGEFAAASKVLNISTQTLMSDLKNGDSILELAQKQGISQQKLISAMEANYKQQMDQAVSSGRISSSQEQQMITRYNANLPNTIARKGMPTFTGRGNFTGHGNFTGNGNFAGVGNSAGNGNNN